jgi:hypothetical protein
MVEANGERPLRTAKINGKFHTLKAVGLQGNVHHEAVAINEAAGITFVFADSARDMDAPAKTRKASASQIARWPELSQYRELDKLPSYEQYRNAPYLLWVKQI